jgi:uncharacterized protein
MKIGILSDTHGYLPPQVFKHFSAVDEIWHAGDVGSVDIITQLQNFKPTRGVFGNIDGQDVRGYFPEYIFFNVANTPILITHIGGYPPRYNSFSKPLIHHFAPKLFVCGHSHILKIQYDAAFDCLHINPGACGKQGWHKVQTLVTLEVNNGKFSNAQVIELAK